MMGNKPKYYWISFKLFQMTSYELLKLYFPLIFVPEYSQLRFWIWERSMSKIYSQLPLIEIVRNSFKVPITLKYFFCLNKSLHLFETHCAFLPLFNPNIDLLQAVKVMKSGHHLSHDWASKGYGSIPCLTSQTSLHACLRRLNTMQISLWHQTRNRPMPLTSLIVWKMMARFGKKVKT